MGSMLETSCGSPHYACPEVIRVRKLITFEKFYFNTSELVGDPIKLFFSLLSKNFYVFGIEQGHIIDFDLILFINDSLWLQVRLST